MRKLEGCVFCSVENLEGEYIIYRDEDVIAFLDIYPVSRGHTLVAPREHYETIFEVPDDVLCKLIVVTKRVANAVRKALKPDGVRIVQNNGKAAGQVIFHLHFHVIPFYEGVHRGRRRLEEQEGLELQRLLSEALGYEA